MLLRAHRSASVLALLCALLLSQGCSKEVEPPATPTRAETPQPPASPGAGPEAPQSEKALAPPTAPSHIPPPAAGVPAGKTGSVTHRGEVRSGEALLKGDSDKSGTAAAGLGSAAKDAPAAPATMAKTWRQKVMDLFGSLDGLAVYCGSDGVWIKRIGANQSLQISDLKVTACFYVHFADALFLITEIPEHGTSVMAMDLLSSDPPFPVLADAQASMCVVVLEESFGCNPNGGQGSLNIGKDKVEIGEIDGNYYRIDEEGNNKINEHLKKLKIENSELLLALARRSATPELPNQPIPAEVENVPKDDCEERSLCGYADPVPGTALVTVVVSHSCGDGCYVGRCLYDPATKSYINPTNPAERTGDVSGCWGLTRLQVSRDGKWLQKDDCVTSWSGEPRLCQKGFGGFLVGGWFVGM